MGGKSGDEMREEVLWELWELNFCFELLALDSRVCTHNSHHESLISACFASCSAASISVADLGTANHRLADEDWEERSPYIQALRLLMASWIETPDMLRKEKWSCMRMKIEDLETGMTTFYVKTFYEHFCRAPILPHGLSHVAAPYERLPPNKIIVEDAHGNTFYDISLLMKWPFANAAGTNNYSYS